MYIKSIIILLFIILLILLNINIREDFISINPYFYFKKKLLKLDKYIIDKNKYLEDLINKKIKNCKKSFTSFESAIKCLNPMK